MLAQPLIEAVFTLIFAKMHAIYNSSVGKRQRDFLAEVFRVLLAHQGRAISTNLPRYSPRHEETFRRHFSRAFDWLAFNLVLVRLRTPPQEGLIGVFDTSFLPRSGRQTWGLDKFSSHTAKAN